MKHTREEVIEREMREFAQLDALVASLADEQWARSLHRPETRDPWTVKDALAHLTFWKANTARVARKEHKPPEERGLDTNEINHLVYLRWHDRPPQEVFHWHRQVHQEVLEALKAAPDEFFGGGERGEQWPFDLDGHSEHHRRKDIERALNES